MSLTSLFSSLGSGRTGLLVAASFVVAACGGSGSTDGGGLTSTDTGGASAAGGGKGASGTGGALAGKGGTTSTGGASGTGASGTGGTGTGGGKAGSAGTGGAAAGGSKGGTGGASGVSGSGATAGASGKAGGAGQTGAGGNGKAGASGSSGQTGAGGSGKAGASGSSGQSGASGKAGAGGGCVPKACVANTDCGSIQDGCGNVIQCGNACPMGQTCGGAGTPNVCGIPPCPAKTCADLKIECGPAGDGCGGSLMCGNCPAGQTCGGGGKAGLCGSMPCVPVSCAAQMISCGPAGDGCNGTLDCGTCVPGETCGLGGPGKCGKPVCVPSTCAPGDCGPVADGCNGLLQCGTCNAPETCGGLAPSKCGVPVSCTNLCLQQQTCPNGGTTSISGVVYAPNGKEPLPNAAVYIPNAAVQPFPAGVSCDTCGAAASGSPLVSAVTAVDGKFTLKNVPVGANIPLVIQIGRWRRQVVIPTVAACVDTPVPAALTHLPQDKTQGDIPLMAFATGSVDALECVMRKIGVKDSEFTKPNGTGRIHIYTGSGSSGADAGGGTPSQSTLVGSQATLNKYDIVLFPCQGGQYDQTAADQGRLISYMDAGGRLFTTHYSYVWLYNDAPFKGTAMWNNPIDPPVTFASDPQTGYIDQSFPKGAALAQWLKLPAVNASTTLGQIELNTLRDNFSGVVAPSQLWISLADQQLGSVPMHYTFNTPVGTPPAQQCGRVVYDDFHVEDAFAFGTTFPAECANGPMTPQEKLLEFMLFDLASCIAPDVPPPCVPKKCTDLGINCGPAGDGCGKAIDCGVCTVPGQTCGGGGTPSVCGAPVCPPIGCAAQGIECGPAGDGCGNLISCGSCPTGQTCGGGGKPGVCGSQMCTPLTCAQQNIGCGPAGNGCGVLIDCGSCPAGQTCGGGGKPGQCGAPPCTPKTCAGLGVNCGPAADGCNGLLQCGTCMVPQTCGGGTPGTPGVCGGNGKPLVAVGRGNEGLGSLRRVGARSGFVSGSKPVLRKNFQIREAASPTTQGTPALVPHDLLSGNQWYEGLGLAHQS